MENWKELNTIKKLLQRQHQFRMSQVQDENNKIPMKHTAKYSSWQKLIWKKFSTA